MKTLAPETNREPVEEDAPRAPVEDVAPETNHEPVEEDTPLESVKQPGGGQEGKERSSGSCL